MKPLRVCIDARFVSGEYGGVEQFVVGLASGLSRLDDGSEEYLFLTYSDSQDWITPYLGGSCRILEDIKGPRESNGLRILKQHFAGLIKLWHRVDPLLFHTSIPQVKSNGIIENAGVEVMHFTGQNAFITNIPSIYHPHDLQHIHLPEYFSLRSRVIIDQMFRTFCHQASVVAVVSDWVRRDLIQQYQLTNDKVKVVPYAPVVSEYSEPKPEDLIEIQKKYSLSEKFLFYPAHTWPHKNHIGLLKALAYLRDQMDTNVSVVFSGRKTDFFPKIKEYVSENQLEDQVTFVGFVSPIELRALYKLCNSVVIPTKFEAGSFPLWEAFLMGVPVACSNVTSLPEQAGGSALLFDPDNVEDMAYQIHRLLADEKLRSDLIDRGKHNVSRYSWEQTARIFRAYYRQIANQPLTRDDVKLLNSPILF